MNRWNMEQAMLVSNNPAEKRWILPVYCVLGHFNWLEITEDAQSMRSITDDQRRCQKWYCPFKLWRR